MDNLRMTFRDKQGWFVIDANLERIYGAHVDKLAAYEDINTSPALLYDLAGYNNQYNGTVDNVKEKVTELCWILGIALERTDSWEGTEDE